MADNKFALVEEVIGVRLTSGLDTAFRLMELAEATIVEEQQRFPEDAAISFQSFSWLRAGASELTEPLYRHHCRELISRYVKLRKGWQGPWPPVERRQARVRNIFLQPTTAECCLALSEISVKAVPNRYVCAAYAQVFCEIFPEQGERMGINPHEISGPEVSLLDDVYAELYAKLRSVTVHRIPEDVEVW